ncbi:MAG: hypothetical protein E3K37_15455 [Candidatus Kuenenia sp.]|nr:hypothetical protein [Candidatus Kuenenia hertensis]
MMRDTRFTITEAEEAKNKLTELKSASAESWEDIKVGMDAALDDLKNAYNKAKLHFQE